MQLVLNTVKQAIQKREVKGTLLHSDQGFQYTSRLYNHLLQEYKMKASMSRKGNCLDNVCIESFFSHLKSECFHLYTFRNADDGKQAIRDYIYFYNHKRFQKKLNNHSPVEFRTMVA